MADRLAHNLTALRRVDPALASAIERSAPSPRLALGAARNGSPTVTVSGSGGPVLLHSSVSPQREAERRARAIGPVATVVLLGLGAGHLARSLLSDRPALSLIVVERDAAALRTLLSLVDLSEAVSAGRVRIAIDPDAVAEALVRVHQPVIAGGLEVERLVPWTDLPQNRDHFVACRRTVVETAAGLEADLAAYRRFGLRWLAHTLANLELLQSGPARRTRAVLGELRRRARAGITVLAAGPSLDAWVAGGAGAGTTLTVAVDTAVRPLARRGVAVDVAVALDPQPWGTLHVAARPTVSLLAADLGVPPAVVRDVRCDALLVTAGGHPLHQLLLARGAPLVQLPSAIGVTEQATRVARALASGEVITVGADHAAWGLCDYARGTYQERYRLARASRTAPIETQAAARVYPRMDMPELRDARLQPILSDDSYRAAARRLAALQAADSTDLFARLPDNAGRFDHRRFLHAHRDALATVRLATGNVATPVVLEKLGPDGLAHLPAVAALMRRHPGWTVGRALAAVQAFVSARIGRYSQTS